MLCKGPMVISAGAVSRQVCTSPETPTTQMVFLVLDKLREIVSTDLAKPVSKKTLINACDADL